MPSFRDFDDVNWKFNLIHILLKGGVFQLAAEIEPLHLVGTGDWGDVKLSPVRARWKEKKTSRTLQYIACVGSWRRCVSPASILFVDFL